MLRIVLLYLCSTFYFLIGVVLFSDVQGQSGNAGNVVFAFPGAEGAGKFTTGGRGTTTNPTTVFEVTNLNDDGSPGSLRYALNQTAVFRTIIFRISGIIHLNSKLNIKANTTIAGQTAPGDGVCLADFPVVISGDNVIVRYLRFRMGDKNQLLTSPAGCGLPVAPFNSSCTPIDGSGGDDSFGNLGNKNIIVDHCSVSWSSDEALTMYRGDSLTLQWNIVSEPLNYSYHFEAGDADFESHGYGGIWGSRHGSFHHNLLAHCKGRMPRFAGSSTYPPGTVGQENADLRNNVIYNWGSYSTNGGEGGNYNVVNNYYKYGPSTPTGNSSGVPIRSEIMNPSKSSTLPYPKVYLSGNHVDGYATATSENWKGVAMSGGSLADTVQSKVTAAFSILPIVEQTAMQAYDLVLKFAGCRLPNRDTLDERIINDVKNRTGKLIDVQGGFPHGTPYSQTVDAWPSLQPGTAPADTDHDGMPDQWENAHGLDPANAADRNAISATGYTNLENYLNNLADDAMDINSTFSAFSQVVGNPSASQTYTIEGRFLRGNIVITPPAGYELSVNGGSSWSSPGTSVTLNETNGTVSVMTVSVRLNAGAAGNYNGSIKHTINGTILSIPVTGSVSAITAVGDIGVDNYISVYPNPTTANLVIKHPVATASTYAEVISLDGKKMIFQGIVAGSNTSEIKTGKLSPGFYILKYTDKKRSVVMKLIKQ